MLITELSLMCLPARAELFKCVAIGDMPYGDRATTYPRFRTLIEQINARKPAFTIHVGDFKSGSSPCTDTMFKEQLDFLNTFEAPLIYTPGDNEWTDCHRDAVGKFDVLECLAKLRAMFFSSPNRPPPRTFGARRCLPTSSRASIVSVWLRTTSMDALTRRQRSSKSPRVLQHRSNTVRALAARERWPSASKPAKMTLVSMTSRTNVAADVLHLPVLDDGIAFLVKKVLDGFQLMPPCIRDVAILPDRFAGPDCFCSVHIG